VDSTGQTIEFMLTAKRDAAAAKRFFRKALSSPGNPVPRFINVDKTRHCVGSGRAETEASWPARPATSVQIPQQHSGTGPSHGKEADLAGQRLRLVCLLPWRTLQGIEAVQDDPEGTSAGDIQGDSIAQAAFIAELFGIAA